MDSNATKYDELIDIEGGGDGGLRDIYSKNQNFEPTRYTKQIQQ